MPLLSSTTQIEDFDAGGIAALTSYNLISTDKLFKKKAKAMYNYVWMLCREIHNTTTLT